MIKILKWKDISTKRKYTRFRSDKPMLSLKLHKFSMIFQNHRRACSSSWTLSVLGWLRTELKIPVFLLLGNNFPRRFILCKRRRKVLHMLLWKLSIFWYRVEKALQREVSSASGDISSEHFDNQNLQLWRKQIKQLYKQKVKVSKK